jgi:hypothetical protein
MGLQAGLTIAVSIVFAPLANAQLVRPEVELNAASAWVSGDTVFVAGGTATHTGGGAVFSFQSGTPVPETPRVVGDVYAVVPDGAGGWFIGGEFSAVSGIPRANLAHIQADLTVADWNPGANGSVRALAFSGSVLFVGGGFTAAAGQPRRGLAAINVTGAALAWNPGAEGGWVEALALNSDGTRLYAGGRFTTVGGVGRRHLAEVDAHTGQPAPWDPNPDSFVMALQVAGGRVYAGGAFTAIAGLIRSHVAAFDEASGQILAWNISTNDVVRALLVRGNTLYMGGSFTSVAGQMRAHLAAVRNDVLSPWNPSASNDVQALAAYGTTIYVGGKFSFLAGQSQNTNALAAVDSATGGPLAWRPAPNGFVYALATGSLGVFAGGTYRTVPATSTFDHYGRFDLSNGTLLPWDPEVNKGNLPAAAMLVHGHQLFLGGAFRPTLGFPNFGDGFRSYLAALDVDTGALTGWFPDPNGSVDAIARSGDTLFISGLFTRIKTVARDGLAAIDTFRGDPYPFAPSHDGRATILAVTGGRVYVGGTFSQIGGQPRAGLAALNTQTGLATGWNPRAEGIVKCVAIGNGRLFAGGDFWGMGGEARMNLAAVDLASGAVDPWNPGINGHVNGLAIRDGILYAGGSFTEADGEPASSLVAFDIASGRRLREWSPNVSGSIHALHLAPDLVIATGVIPSVEGWPSGSLAIFEDAGLVVQIDVVRIEAHVDRVNLEWIASGRAFTSAALYRREDQGMWEWVADLIPDVARHLTYVDGDVRAGGRYEYQIGVSDQGSEQFLGRVTATVPGPASFALLGAMPNPARNGRPVVAFSVDTSAPARLRAFDLSGRIVADLQVGGRAPGRHVVELPRLRPGRYLIQLIHGGRTHSSRAVVLE